MWISVGNSNTLVWLKNLHCFQLFMVTREWILLTLLITYWQVCHVALNLPESYYLPSFLISRPTPTAPPAGEEYHPHVDRIG